MNSSELYIDLVHQQRIIGNPIRMVKEIVGFGGKSLRRIYGICDKRDLVRYFGEVC